MDKKIIVIDDAGEDFKSLSKLFEDDLEIKILHSKSNLVDLKKSLRRDTYIILINEDDLETDLNQLFESIKNHLFYFTVPIMILSSNEKLVENQELLEFPIVNYVLKPFDEENFKIRMEYAIENFEYNKNINDISGLPGSNVINRKLLGEISKDSKFAFVFLDLDNFKEFGEYYGLYKGSQVLVFLSNLLHETIIKYGSIDDFIGHVGGDDFVMILNDYRQVELICNEIIEKFDEKIVDFYDSADLKNHYIEVVNRAGEVERLSVMGISVISLNYTAFKDNTFDDVYKKMMEIKKEAKMIKGSVLLNK